MKRAILVMVLGRVFLLSMIIAATLKGAYSEAIMNTIIFFLTSFVPILGMYDKRFLYLDAAIMGVFSATFLAIWWPFWEWTYGTVFGLDKIFHMVGGALVAWFVVIATDRYLSGKKLVLAALGATLFIGISWEAFEWALGILPEPFYVAFLGWADSSWDLVADLIGASIVLSRQAFKGGSRL